MEFLEAINQGAVYPFRHIAGIEAIHPLLFGMAYLGEIIVLLVVLLLGLCLLQMWRESRTAWLVAITVAVAALVTAGSKQLVDRRWPNVPWSPLPVAEEKSFPSGHALGATVVYGSLGFLLARRLASRRLRITLRVLACLLPFLAGFARMLVGHQFFLDVIAGWAGGALLVMVCLDIDKRMTATSPRAAEVAT